MSLIITNTTLGNITLTDLGELVLLPGANDVTEVITREELINSADFQNELNVTGNLDVTVDSVNVDTSDKIIPNIRDNYFKVNQAQQANDPGFEAAAAGADAIAIGPQARGSAENAVAIGQSAIASNDHTVALGRGSSASGRGGVALGTFTNADSDYAIAVGYNALAADNIEAISVGRNCFTRGADSIGIGGDVFIGTTSNKAVVIGNEASGGQRGTIIGGDAFSFGYGSTVIGSFASANNANTTAIGFNAAASSTNAVSVGYNALSSLNGGISIGSNSSSLELESIAIGLGASVSGLQGGAESSIAIGEGASVASTSVILPADRAIAIGQNSSASGNRCIVAGYNSVNSGPFSVALGERSNVTGGNSVGIGSQVQAAAGSSIAIGSSALITNNLASGAVQIGTGTNGTANTLQYQGVRLASSDGLVFLATTGVPTATPPFSGVPAFDEATGIFYIWNNNTSTWEVQGGGGATGIYAGSGTLQASTNTIVTAGANGDVLRFNMDTGVGDFDSVAEFGYKAFRFRNESSGYGSVGYSELKVAYNALDLKFGANTPIRLNNQAGFAGYSLTTRGSGYSPVWSKQQIAKVESLTITVIDTIPSLTTLTNSVAYLNACYTVVNGLHIDNLTGSGIALDSSGAFTVNAVQLGFNINPGDRVVCYFYETFF